MFFPYYQADNGLIKWVEESFFLFSESFAKLIFFKVFDRIYQRSHLALIFYKKVLNKHFNSYNKYTATLLSNFSFWNQFWYLWLLRNLSISSHLLAQILSNTLCSSFKVYKTFSYISSFNSDPRNVCILSFLLNMSC